MRLLLSVAAAGITATSAVYSDATASDVTLDISLPRIPVAEYHRPYVAAWVSTPNHAVVANLAVWYQQTDGPEGHGTKWLKDIRQWWRRTGRTLDLPIDGVSGPTQAPGTHKLEFSTSSGPFAAIKAGSYILHVEASREVGDRELVSIPFTWDETTPFSGHASGTAELGSISLSITP